MSSERREKTILLTLIYRLRCLPRHIILISDCEEGSLESILEIAAIKHTHGRGQYDLSHASNMAAFCKRIMTRGLFSLGKLQQCKALASESSPTIFSKIISKEIPADILYEDDQV